MLKTLSSHGEPYCKGVSATMVHIDGPSVMQRNDRTTSKFVPFVPVVSCVLHMAPHTGPHIGGHMVCVYWSWR